MDVLSFSSWDEKGDAYGNKPFFADLFFRKDGFYKYTALNS